MVTFEIDTFNIWRFFSRGLQRIKRRLRNFHFLISDDVYNGDLRDTLGREIPSNCNGTFSAPAEMSAFDEIFPGIISRATL